MTVPVPSVENFKSEDRPKATKGLVTYANRPKDGEWFKYTIGTTENGRTFEGNLTYNEVEVDVNDVRAVDKEFKLEKEGFTLQKINVPEIDWKNKEEIEKLYYPEVEKVIKAATGATRVHVFDATLRHGHINLKQFKEVLQSQNVKFYARHSDFSVLKMPYVYRPQDGKPNQANGPVNSVHVDYDHISGIDRLDALLPEEAAKLRETPFAIIQAWKPLKGPVRSSPLGVIDASTVDKNDLTLVELIFPERVGRTLAVHHNPNQKFWYASGINTDEIYLFVCYDSRRDRARFTPHTGFKDLSVGDDAPPRESVEIRSYVFWEDLPPQKVEREF